MSLNVLIVKTSSLGDIVQAFSVLDALGPHQVDWIVEKRFASLLAAHPRVREVLVFEPGSLRGWWRSLALLRRRSYDVVFDIQGNCKSGVLTLAARAKDKVGFGRRSVREWPNLLATNIRFEVSREGNIRLQLMSLVQRYFNQNALLTSAQVCFNVDEAERELLRALLSAPELRAPQRIMVCPGSKWINKQLPTSAWVEFLQQVRGALDAAFLLMWGDLAERAVCEEIARALPGRSVVVDRLAIPVWQNLMTHMDLILAVDSSALHLAATTAVPTFSLFGPTRAEVFKPMGDRHFAFQGACPYEQKFVKQCPKLRSCPTGGCIRALSGKVVFEAFWEWWRALKR